MISWIQRYFQKHFRLVFIVLLIAIGLPMVVIYSAGGGRVNRFFIGLTEGVYIPEPTVEDIAGNFDKIRDEDGYSVLHDPNDEFAALKRLVEGAR